MTRGKSGPPRFANAGIERIPLLGKQFQIELGFRLGTRGVDGFEVSCDLFHMFVGHIAQRVAHQMHHAQLHPCLWIDRLYGFGQAGQAIHAGNEDVLIDMEECIDQRQFDRALATIRELEISLGIPVEATD
jgi:hypothetical protein